MDQLQPQRAPLEAPGETAWLQELQREVQAHPAVNHPLLSRVGRGRDPRAELRSFGLQHYALVGFFTTYMEQLLVRGESSRQKLWLAKVLVDEYGEGSEGEDHAALYRHFLRHAGAREGEESSTPLCAAAWEFVHAHLRLCSDEPFLVGLGALGPGHEWAIPSMFQQIEPGLRRGELGEAGMAYFLLHCEQDVDHGAWMSEVLVDLARGEEQRAQVRRGARLSLEARERLWAGIEAQLADSAPSQASPGDLSALRASLRPQLELVPAALPAAGQARAPQPSR